VNKRNLVVSLVASLLVVGAIAGYLASGARPQLGLDLRGGISAIYSPVLAEGEERPEDFEEVLDETIEIIRARVDSLGVAEPEISRQGEDVLVQLPGLQDPERAQEVIGTTAQLTFRPVEELLPPGSDEGPDCTGEVPELAEDESGILCGSTEETAAGEPTTEAPKYRVGPAALTGDRIEDAIPVLQGANAWSVSLDLDGQGAEQFAQITGELACQRDQGQPGLLAIVLDDVVESAPAMNPEVACGRGITGGQASISVGGTLEESESEARDLALVLRTGALPITLEPSTFDTVSPTLGAESLKNGLLAGVIGLALVAIYLLVFYRVLGLVAIGQLLLFGALMMGIITLLGDLIGFSLTLAGVAGIIVSIGITADSSIIFFERLRDEVALGKTVRTAANKAFESAFRTNLTGNTSTLAAAAILYMLAVGPVRGFAFTLGLATILDIFILYFFTRPAVGLLAGGGRVSRRSVRAPEPATAGGPR
jgi:preprotein translocase subunit SecD